MIREWRRHVTDLNPEEMIEEIRESIGSAEEAAIRNLDLDGISNHMRGLLARFDVGTTVTGAPEGYRFTATDPAPYIVRHIGKHAGLWLSSQPAVKEEMDRFRSLNEEFARAEKRDARFYFEYLNTATSIGRARTAELVPLLRNVHGPSAMFHADDIRSIRSETEFHTANEIERERVTDHLKEVSNLFPESFKNKSGNPRLVVGIGSIRPMYSGSYEWRDENGVTSKTAVILYNNDMESLAHEIVHHAQGSHHYLRSLEALFVQQRASGSTPRQYDNDPEPCFPDEFPNIYTGKVYPGGSREVLTTGVQQLFFGWMGAGVGASIVDAPGCTQTDPDTGRLRADPDHLDFTLGVLLSAP